MKNKVFIIVLSLFMLVFLTAFNKKSESENIIDILLGYVENDISCEEGSPYKHRYLVLDLKKTVDFDDDVFTENQTYTDYPYT